MRKIRYLNRLLVVGIAISLVATAAASAGILQPGAAAVDDASTSAPEFASSSITDQRGDVVPIAVRMSEGESATVDVLGVRNDYEGSVTVRDDNFDGLVTIELNTFVPGESAEFRTAAEGDSLTVRTRTNLSGPLPTGQYRLRIGDVSETADLFIEPRETKGMATMVAPADGYDWLDDREAVVAGREAGNLTRRTGEPNTVVATRDTLVFRVKASGLSGTLAVQSGDDTTSRFVALAESDHVTVDLVQTNPVTSKEAAHILLDRDGVRIIQDRRFDTYYVVVDTERAHIRRGTDGEVSTGLPMGARFRANLTVEAGSPLATDGDETVGTAVRVVERSASLRTHRESGQGFVDPARDQPVAGTTTLAPGSSVTVTVTTEAGVDRSRTVTVGTGDELGTVNASVDLHRLDEGTEIRVGARDRFGSLVAEPFPATVRSVEASLGQDGLRTSPGTVAVAVNTSFSRGGLVVVRARNQSGQVVGVAPVSPGGEDLTVALETVPPKDTKLVVSAVRDMDNDGRYTPDVDVAYTESNSPRPLDTSVVLYELPPSPTPTPVPTTGPPGTPGGTTAPGGDPGGEATRTDTPDFGPPDFEVVPGFGPGAALVALLAVLVALRQRE